MSREDPQMKIRLPAELKDQIEAASKELGRSMNAEIVARLEGSFEARGAASTAGDAIQQYVAAAQHESVVLGLRAELVKLKYESLRARISAISAQAELLAKTAQTDEDFARAEAKVGELDGIEREAEVFEAELEDLFQRRMAVLESIQTMRTAVAQKASDLEESLAQYKASMASPSR